MWCLKMSHLIKKGESMGVDLCFLCFAGHGHSCTVRALVEVADGKALISITASCSSPWGKIAEGSRRTQDSSIIQFVPVLHCEMVT